MEQKNVVLKVFILLSLLLITSVNAFAALSDGLTHYYSMETNDSILHDEYNLVNATAVGAVTLTGDGKIGNGASFSDNGFYYAFGQSIWTEGTSIPYTYNVWVKNTVGNDGYVWGDFGVSDRFNAFFMYQNSSYEIVTCDGATSCSFAEGITAGIPQEYTMLTVIENSTHTTFYVNGTFDTTYSTLTYGGSSHTDQRLAGRNGGVGITNGEQDEMGVWNRSLSSAEVSQLYNAGVGLSFAQITGSNVTNSTPTVILNFTARNISNGALSSFCVSATGTNTFTSCTTNGTIYTILNGTYTFVGFNATGFTNQTVSSYVFDHNQSIQFNFTEINLPPVINTVTMTASTDNTTLFFSANVSDPNNDPVSFLWVLYKDNTNIDSGTDGTFQANHNIQFRNHSTSGNGTYILQVRGSDGQLSSSSTNSTPVIITVSTSNPVTPSTTSTFFNGFLVSLIGFMLVLISTGLDGEAFTIVSLLGLGIFALGILILILSNI